MNLGNYSLGPQERLREPTAVAIMTSGGDSQGMNAAVRAVVRSGTFSCSKIIIKYKQELYWGQKSFQFTEGTVA